MGEIIGCIVIIVLIGLVAAVCVVMLKALLNELSDQTAKVQRRICSVFPKWSPTSAFIVRRLRKSSRKGISKWPVSYHPAGIVEFRLNPRNFRLIAGFRNELQGLLCEDILHLLSDVNRAPWEGQIPHIRVLADVDVLPWSVHVTCQGVANSTGDDSVAASPHPPSHNSPTRICGTEVNSSEPTQIEPAINLSVVKIGSTNAITVTPDATFGRAKSCFVSIADNQVSRTHFHLSAKGDTWQIEDLGSANGTFVNGERLHAPRFLSDGDLLRCGSSGPAWRSRMSSHSG